MYITRLLCLIVLAAVLNICAAARPALPFAPCSRAVKDTVEPVIHGDFADPSVIRVGNIYYATGTSSEWAPHYPLFRSGDLVHWKQSGYIFNKAPDWTSSSFWAPELLYRKGTYYVYYTARKKSDGISCIGVATSDDPEKGFTDRGIIVEFGKEAIDAFMVEENGVWYITFKAYGLDNRPIELLGYQLSEDGLKTVGQAFMLLRDDDRKGMEGQCIVRRNNYYYLLYSAGGCCGLQCSYHVNVARSRTLKGPYTRFEGNPVMAAFDGWKCTGHGTVVTGKNGADYYLFHAYNNRTDVHTGRQGMLARLNWDTKTGWPSFDPVAGEPVRDFSDDFSKGSLGPEWQWDFRHTQPLVRPGKGRLYLSGTAGLENRTGTALTVRPYYGNYEMTTAVLNRNSALKGLTVYADADQAVGIGIKNDSIEVWCVKDNIRRVLGRVKVNGLPTCYLKMTVTDGQRLGFYWSGNQRSWNEVRVADAGISQFLPPWDRSSRPGLLQQGTGPAAFGFFRIRYF
ncbi:family 43 glycosylhydrolase [Niabella drilacis]|uniref:Beta-xylosidase n=1 Tax=Niabella drilacis (strain DSM 25811 / CCM 8410 / CCUG 62505 / LMG 26954 / E90) TaxID=1285928 RepID=A0A1G6L1T2_NIADE|nr:family 43 glycosylhydrolase [Niabella drilacis]SDC37280.1 Beta-xylosidase [Niabella drilacis]